MIWLKVIYGQILTVIANVLVLCLVSSFSMVISPLTTKYAFFTHLVNQPLSEQLRMSVTSFTKRRYMIGQDGRRPIGSFLGMICIAFIGLVFFFLSTIVFQSSDTSLRRAVTGKPQLIDTSSIPTQTSTDTTYPLISDSFLGNVPVAEGVSIQASPEFTKYTAPSAQSQTEFSGNASVFLDNANWISITDGDFVTTVSMEINGITADELSSTSPGTVDLLVLDNGSPSVFDDPTTSSTIGSGYAFAVEGKFTLDYLYFELTSFDVATYSDADCLQEYYDFVTSHTVNNGTLILNNTYDYNNSQSLNKDTLESNFAKASDEVRYSSISVQNQTLKTDTFQTYFITKRSAVRQSLVQTQYGNIQVVEYDYTLRITTYDKKTLDSAFKTVFTANKANYGLPVTPLFRTNNPDFLNIAALANNDGLYQLFKYETYINILPTVVLIGVFGGLALIFTLISEAYNFRRFRNKAYSIPLESLNYLLYQPSKVLFPLFQKVRKAEFSMVDGYDPATGYNHIGLVPPEDANGVTRREPDVPYGLVYKTNKNGMLQPGVYA